MLTGTFHSKFRANKHGDVVIALGPSEAGRQVDVVVKPVALKQERADYQKLMKKLAGAWKGDFEEPKELPYEIREEL